LDMRDHRSFGAIYQRYHGSLWNMCCRLCRTVPSSICEAGDLFHDTLFKLHRYSQYSQWRCPPEDDPEQCEAFLWRIASNQLRSVLRQHWRYMGQEPAKRRQRGWRGRRPQDTVRTSRRRQPHAKKLPDFLAPLLLPDPAPDPAERVADSDWLHRIRQLQDSNNDDQSADAFWLFVEGTPIDEIGQLLGLTAPTLQRRRIDYAHRLLHILAKRQELGNLVDRVAARLDLESRQVWHPWTDGIALEAIPAALGLSEDKVRGHWKTILNEVVSTIRQM
jgi:DNA-directed RNA polymerase specialized sigma24 family protein